MRYRFADKSDLSILAEWNHQLIQDEGHRNTMSVAELRARMKSLIKREYTAVLFEEGGQAVAYALYRMLPQEIYLRQFFVDRARRRQGIGRGAMALLFREVWPRDRRLIVEVLCHNTAALGFWRAMGYKDYAMVLEIMPPS